MTPGYVCRLDHQAGITAANSTARSCRTASDYPGGWNGGDA
jgi:hypothetical protein